MNQKSTQDQFLESVMADAAMQISGDIADGNYCIADFKNINDRDSVMNIFKERFGDVQFIRIIVT